MQSSSLEPLGLGIGDFFFFFVSRLTFLIIYFGLPCVHTRSWKRLVINRGVKGERGLNAPQLPPAASLSSEAQHASI